MTRLIDADELLKYKTDHEMVERIFKKKNT